jgi:hypothetical protein
VNTGQISSKWLHRELTLCHWVHCGPPVLFSGAPETIVPTPLAGIREWRRMLTPFARLAPPCTRHSEMRGTSCTHSPCKELTDVGAHSSCTPYNIVHEAGLVMHGESGGDTIRMRGASCSKSSWHAHHSLGKVEASRCPCASARRQRQRLCCCIESRSQPSEVVKARSAVLAASAQLQGSTEVPNVKRAAAHCHLVVVGGHVDAAAPAGDASDQSEDFGCSGDS